MMLSLNKSFLEVWGERFRKAQPFLTRVVSRPMTPSLLPARCSSVPSSCPSVASVPSFIVVLHVFAVQAAAIQVPFRSLCPLCLCGQIPLVPLFFFLGTWAVLV